MRSTLVRFMWLARLCLVIGFLICGQSFAALSQEQEIPNPDVNQAQNYGVDCLSCHGKNDLMPRTPRGQILDLYVPASKFADGVHGKIQCVECHMGATSLAADFQKIPHDLSLDKPAADCIRCHGQHFTAYYSAFEQSVHGKKFGLSFDDGKIGKPHFNCASCHDVHTMLTEGQNRLIPRSIVFDNAKCLACHADLRGFKALSNKEVWQQDMGHSFLAQKDLHFTQVRCVTCHASAAESTSHLIVAKEQALRDCTVCHSGQSQYPSMLQGPPSDTAAGQFLGVGLFDDAKIREQLARLPEATAVSSVVHTDEAGFVNRGQLRSSYMIGATRNVVVDHWVGWILLAMIAGVSAHGGLRFLLRRAGSPRPFVSTYVYSWPVRLWHWINAVAVILLLLTGFSMHFAGKPCVLGFEFSVHVHDICAIVFMLNFGLFLLAAALNGDLIAYLPHFARLPYRLYLQVRFYLWGIFRGEPHPFAVDKKNRFNPLQKGTYIPIVFLMIPLVIVTGLFMLFPEWTPDFIYDVPGRQVIATLHYVVAVCFLVFLVLHIYLSTTGRDAASLIKGMFTGYHEEEK